MKKLCAILAAGLAAGAGCGGASTDAIVPYSRENNSGTYMYFKEHVLNDVDFAAHVQTLPGTASVVNAVSKDKRSIGYGGIAYDKGVKVLKVKKDAGSAAIEPNVETVVKGTYPISRYLFFYTVGEPEGAIKHFIEWTRGKEGQDLCEKVGYFPLPEDKRSKPSEAPPAEKKTITVKGSDTMVILGGRWAETYMKAYSGVTLQITGGGSGTGIKALIDGETHICQASRPMKAEEKKKVKDKHGKDPVEIAVALDGLAIFVHPSNPLTEISIPQLKVIYTGKVRKWSELRAH